MQRHESGLGAKPDHRQQKQHTGQSLRVNSLFYPDIEIHGTRFTRQQKEKGQQKGRAQMGGDQINPAGFPDGLAFMLERHEEKRRNRHQFPGNQEQHRIARQQHEHHAQHQQAVEKPDRTQRTPPLPRPQITDAVNGRERREQKRRHQEPR